MTAAPTFFHPKASLGTLLSILLSSSLLPLSARPLAGNPLKPGHPSPPAKNIVLVRGAFADGSGWRGVYDELTKGGFRVTIVQNPLTSLEDDVAATQRVLDRQDGPTILVGHSWGGTVITEAGIHPNVNSVNSEIA